MHIDLEQLSDTQLRSELEKYLRLFDVAHGALLRLADARMDADAMRKQVTDAIKTIEAYPNHLAFTTRFPDAQS